MVDIKKVKVGDTLLVIGNANLKHWLELNKPVQVTNINTKFSNTSITVTGKQVGTNNIIGQSVNINDLSYNNQTKSTKMKLMKDAVIKAAKELLVANNTFTTLELKLKLRKDEPSFYWTQTTVSKYMDELAQEGAYSYVDNGTYRVYSDPNRVAKTPIKIAIATKPLPTVNSTNISKKKALELMKNNKGHFFTVEFIKQDGTLRKINGQYVKDQKNSQLGYVLVKESSLLKAKAKEPIRNVNLQTLKTLKIGGQFYKVK